MLDEITKRIILGGQRIHMERDYVNQSYQKLRDSVTKGDFGSGLYHLVPGIIEAASIPVMEKFVPRVKLAVYYDLLERRLAELPGDPHPDTLARLATEVSDHVDNAFGEMVKDNLHWSRPMRDVLSAAMLSPTWNIGSFRGFAGAVTDVRKFAPNQRTLLTYQDGIDSKGHPIYKTVSEHWLSLRLGWAIGVLLMAAYLSNLYQWLLHGQGPQGRVPPPGQRGQAPHAAWVREGLVFLLPPAPLVRRDHGRPQARAGAGHHRGRDPE
jgi:hypothetical protein